MMNDLQHVYISSDGESASEAITESKCELIFMLFQN